MTDLLPRAGGFAAAAAGRKLLGASGYLSVVRVHVGSGTLGTNELATNNVGRIGRVGNSRRGAGWGQFDGGAGIAEHRTDCAPRATGRREGHPVQEDH